MFLIVVLLIVIIVLLALIFQKLDMITKFFPKPVSDYSDDSPDPLFDKALKIVKGYDHASASLLQRRLAIGYARAARLLDQLEEAGHVEPADGSKPRKVLKKA